MKNIFKSGLLAVVMTIISFACSNDDNTVVPGDFYLSVGASNEGTAIGLPGKTVDIELNLRASQGIASLTADGAGVTVTDGELAETVTYEYTVPASSAIFGDVTVTFQLRDADGNTTSYDFTVDVEEDASTFTELDMIDLGAGEGAAEISAYDTLTQQLFVVNNDDAAGNNRIDVIDLSNPANISLVTSIDLTTFGGAANSVAVSEGRLAVAVEANTTTDNGVVLIYETDNLSAAPAQVNVGALPDMVTFSPDGDWIIVANEGEPNDAYTIDPEGSVSVIDASGTAYSVQTATFTAFNSEEAALEANGFRVFGPGATLAEDVEPEYVTVSSDSETAYVTLQENNGVAVVDIASATVTAIWPLGFKDYTESGNEIDPSNEDGLASFRSGVQFPLFGVYQPDAIATFTVDETDYLITANEGDSRDYGGFSNEARISTLTLDATVFPNAAELQTLPSFGRLLTMQDLGDTGGDADYDEFYSYGARSFSIWDTDGNQVFDSGNDLDARAIAAGIYDDGRSDDKGSEPEGVTIGVVNGATLAFIGLERVDAVAVYDVTNPESASYVAMITAGDAPEGLVFIPADQSPNDRSLLIVSSEDDGTVRVYQTNQ